ncbi:hypothetical protein MY3957_005037 [Beauveria namnaoensis]
MAQHDIPTHLAPGVTMANNDDEITIKIMTKPPSDDVSNSQDTRALWYAAYARLRERYTGELVDFEEQVRIIFRLLQGSSDANVHRRFTMTGLHNLAPNTVLDSVHRWISKARAEENDDEERDKVCRALVSTLTKLSRNIQKSPNAHLAWIAACLCIQKLVKGPKPTCEAPWLAYIVARIAFYDRLSQVIYKAPRDDEQGPNSPHEFLVDLYSAILEQLVVVLALDRAPREMRRQQKQKTFAQLKVGVNSTLLHPITALEFSLGFHARDKTLEESVAELVCLRAPSLAILGSDDRDTHEAANETMTAEGGGGGGGDNRDPDNDFSHPAYRDVSNANATAERNSNDSSISRKVQKLLCLFPVKPPPLLPPSQLPLDRLKSVLGGLRRWALKQDAYQQWHKARSADHGHSTDRILWLHGPEGSSMTLLLQALAQAETENQVRILDPEWAPYAVACASWDWSRDVNGTSVVSVLRDLIWTVLTTQPMLQKHLAKTVQVMGRRALLRGDGRDSQARYAALGTSGDFYAMLTLLCSIVSDQDFEPTCFVVDYREMLWDDDDDGHVGDQAKGNESCKEGRDGSASTAQKRAWTLRDLMELVSTTCRLSGKVIWIVRSMSCLPPSSSIGGCHLYPPEEPLLSEIMHDYIRALMQKWGKSRYTPKERKQLASKITDRAGGNVAWATLAVDLVARVRFSWNADHVLQGLPDSSAGLGPLLDCIIKSNASDSDSDSDRALLNAALKTAALAFQPLTVPDLAALAGLPATVDAASFLDILARPLLEFREVDDARGKVKKYVYFPSRAVLAVQRARLVKATPAPDLHADMVCRHLRQLTQHYGHTGRRTKHRGKQLSPYMQIAWLRHLDLAGVGIGRTGHQSVTDLLTADVRAFVAQNASAWVRDLDALGVLPVVGRMLQDLLPSSRGLGRLSPTQAALNTLLTRILRSQEMGMSVTDCDRFMHIVGCENHGDDGDLPVLPQVPLILPPLDNSTTAFIGTLKGDSAQVLGTHFAYDGRLIVSISDDCTLRCWDRASCRIQHVARKTVSDRTKLFFSPTNSSLILFGNKRIISAFDLARGGVHVESITHSKIVAEWQKQEKEQEKQKGHTAADEVLEPFSAVRSAVDGSNDVIITCGPREVVLGMSGFGLKEVRRIAVGYKSLPTVIKDALPESDCLDASVADDVELAAIVHNDGNLLIYNTKLAERQQTLHWAQRRFARVRYDSNTRAFVTWDEGDHVMLHLVHERRDQLEEVEHGEREPTKLSYRPLIQSHRPPYPDPDSSLLSFGLSSERDEIIFTFADTESCQIYRLIKADADTRNNVAYVDNAPHISSPRQETTDASSPFSSTLFSHDGLQAATSNENGQVQLWSLPKMATSESETSDASATTLWRTMPSEGAKSAIIWLCFSSDDTQLLACYGNGQTVVWDTKTCERVAVMGEDELWAAYAIFSPGDALVATVHPDDKTIRLWDLQACRQLYSDAHRIGDDGNDDDKPTPTTKQTFVALNDAAINMTTTVTFSPDGRLLATSGSFIHIWDISPDSGFNMVLPGEALMPCATLYCNDTAIQSQEEDDDDDGDDDDDDDEDDDDDDDDLGCISFAFSPDSRSLFGFCRGGLLLVWKRALDPPSLYSSSSPSSDGWQPQATVLAGGFKMPGQDGLWTYEPRRPSILEDMDGRYLLHTEIGVWELPSQPGDDTVGLQPSMRHPCSVVETPEHMAILWQNRLLTKLPQIYTPSPPCWFEALACDVHTVDESTSTLLIDARTGHLFCFRFQGKEQITNASEKIDSA